jgi:hypothetical protein
MENSPTRARLPEVSATETLQVNRLLSGASPRESMRAVASALRACRRHGMPWIHARLKRQTRRRIYFVALVKPIAIAGTRVAIHGLSPPSSRACRR